MLSLAIRALIAGTLALASSGTSAADSGASLETKIDKYLAPLIATNNFSGVVLVAKEDTVVFQKGYGRANLEHDVAMTPETVFHVASVSKPFTAAAILKLAERGRIDLRAPLTRIIPDYPNGSRLTVHHLLSHTSGIPNINNFPEYDTIQFTPHTPEELVAYFKDKPLEFEPGAKYRYSNSNYNLLALIVEKVSGLAYGEFLSRELFRPLGLAHTGHPHDMGEIVPRQAEGYAPRDFTDLEHARYIDWSVKVGNGSLYTTAGDLVKFFRAVHTGRVLNAASLKQSFTPHTPGVGYGWFLTKANNRELHHINGRQPGWSAQADYYVNDGVSVIVLSNLYISVTTPIARALGALYFGEPYEELPAISAQPLTKKQAAALVGTYQLGPDYYVPNQRMTIVNDEGHLFAAVDGAPPAALLPITPTSFIVRPYWIKADFVPAKDGRAREMVVDGFHGARVK